MITEYIDCCELKRLIEEKKIKLTTLKTYLKKRGLIFTASNAQDLAEQFFTLFLGVNEINEIRELIDCEGNYEKSVVLKVKVNGLQDEENIIDILGDEINHIRTVKLENYTIETSTINDNEIEVFFSYNRKLPGKNRLLQDEVRYLRMNIIKKSDNEAIVDIRQPSSIDTNRAIDFLGVIIKNEERLSLNHIDLEKLTEKNKIELFDRVAAYHFSDWHLKTITGITVKKSEDDDNEKIISEEDESNATLRGINQAILNGKGLRDNEFVSQSLNNGYYIFAMKYRYEIPNDETEFVIMLGFKGEDLRIEIDKTYYKDDEKTYIQPMLRKEQDIIIRKFQDCVIEVYEELIREQING